jgi:hypothetical protein
MDIDDYNRFKSVMTGMAKVYERELDSLLMDAYWLTLKSWPLTEFEQAAAHLMATAEHMPRPAAFTALRKSASGSNADESWGELLANHGQTSDPIAQRALRALGGWNVVGFVDTDRLPYLKKQFSDAYASLSESNDASQALPQITNGRLQIADLAQRMKA